MVDPTLGGRIDLREAAANVDVESLVEGTRYADGEEGPVASVAGEFGAILGRVLGTVVGYALGLALLDGAEDSGGTASDGGDGGEGDQNE